MGKLSKYTEGYLGSKVTVYESSYDVGDIKTLIVRNNPDRYAVLLCNNGVYDVYVSFTPDTELIGGILLNAYGGNLILVANEDGELCGLEMYARTTQGVSNVYILEIVGL